MTTPATPPPNFGVRNVHVGGAGGAIPPGPNSKGPKPKIIKPQKPKPSIRQAPVRKKAP